MTLPSPDFRSPFLPAFAGASFGIGALDLRKHLDLTSNVGRLVTLWSHIENDITVTLAILLGVGEEIALELFPAFRKLDKLESLLKAGSMKLAPDMRRVIGAITKEFGRLGAVRDAAAHGVFGKVDGQPMPTYSWISQTDYVRFANAVHPALKASESTEPQWHELRKTMMVCTSESFDKSYEAFEELWHSVFDVNCWLRDQAGALGARHLKLLHARPRFAAALALIPYKAA